jgi:hypothetical protein
MIFFIYNSNKLKHQVTIITVTRWKHCTLRKNNDKIHEERTKIKTPTTFLFATNSAWLEYITMIMIENSYFTTQIPKLIFI